MGVFIGVLFSGVYNNKVSRYVAVGGLVKI